MLITEIIKKYVYYATVINWYHAVLVQNCFVETITY